MSTCEEKKVCVQQTQRHDAGQARGFVIELCASVAGRRAFEAGEQGRLLPRQRSDAALCTVSNLHCPPAHPDLSDPHANLFVQETLVPATRLEAHGSGTTVTLTERGRGRETNPGWRERLPHGQPEGTRLPDLETVKPRGSAA